LRRDYVSPKEYRGKIMF